MNKKVWGGFLSAAVVAFCATTAVGAIGAKVGDNISSQKTVQIKRTINGVIGAVENHFDYSVTQDPSNPAEVINAPTGGSIIFDKTAPMNNSVIGYGEIDFSQAEFTVLGDYKFIIKESYSSNPANFPVSNDEYYVYVYVRNEMSTDGPTGNLVATLAGQAIAINGEKKDISFSSDVDLSFISFSKNVSGNLGDTNRYFRFKVEIGGGTVGDRYIVIGQDSSVIYGGDEIETQAVYTVGVDNYIYLKHGQMVTIGKNGTLGQIPVGVTYVITEDTPEDYIPYVNDERGNTSGEKKTISLIESDSEKSIVRFVNNKESAVVTGVNLVAIPLACGSILVLAFYLAVRNRRKSDR